MHAPNGNDWRKQLRQFCRDETAYQSALQMLSPLVEHGDSPVGSALNIDPTPEQILHSQQALVYVLDVDQRICFMNATCEKFSGYQLCEVLGKRLDELFINETQSAMHDEFIHQILIDRSVHDHQCTWRIRDGSLHTMNWMTGPFRNEAGEVCGIVATGIVIPTEQKAKEELQERDYQLRQLFAIAPIGIVLHCDGKIITANEMGKRIMGAESVPDLAGQPVIQFVHPDSRAVVVDRIRTMISTGKPVGAAIEKFVSLDGKAVDVETVAVPVTHEGKPAVFALFADISKRKQIEDELVRSEAQYRTLFEHAPVGIATYNVDGKFTAVNQCYLDIFGITREEFFKLNVRDIKDSDIRNALLSTLQGNPSFFEGAYTSMISGKNINIRVYMNSFRDSQGKVVGGVSIIDDLTDRVQQQSELHQSLQLFELVVENTPNIAIQAYNRAGRISRWNLASETLYGFSKNEALGKTLAELFPDHSIGKEFEASLKEIWSTGKPLPVCEWEVPTFDGGKRWVLSSTFPVYMNGEVAEVFCMDVDVTAHRLAEDEIKSQRAWYQKLTETIEEVIAELDAKGCYTYVSPNCDRTFGWKAEEVVGKSYEQFLHPEDNPGIPVFESMREPGTVISIECRMRHKDQHWLLIEATFQSYISNTGEWRVVIVARDVTEKKRVQDERLRAQKLESIGLLAGGIAHDFNNLLTGIVGSISFAKHFPDSREEVQKLLEEAERTAMRAKDLTQQLLTFSKGGAPVRKLCDLAALLRETVSFSLRGSKTSWRFRIDDDLRTVEADEGQISQVIQNLVINADQAMPHGGYITVYASNVALEEEFPNRNASTAYVKFAIEDRGVGIAPEITERVFDPYFTTKQTGSGLGLATCFSIINNHHGHIAVTSAVGIGTKFTVYLPSVKEILQKSEHNQDEVPRGSGRILVMDDEEIIRTMLTHILSYLGYEVVAVQDGESALDAYQMARASGTPFDLVIMDLTIPGGMGGAEAIRELKKLHPESKAIVSSGYSNDPVMADFRSYGFNGMVAKPYEVAGIGRVIAEVLNNGSSL